MFKMLIEKGHQKLGSVVSKDRCSKEGVWGNRVGDSPLPHDRAPVSPTLEVRLCRSGEISGRLLLFGLCSLGSSRAFRFKSFKNLMMIL